MPRRQAAGWLAFALWVAGGGCNTSAPDPSRSTEEATITGAVRVRGKSVTNGEITFRSSNVNRRDAPASYPTARSASSHSMIASEGRSPPKDVAPIFRKTLANIRVDIGRRPVIVAPRDYRPLVISPGSPLRNPRPIPGRGPGSTRSLDNRPSDNG
jgi:hypothetical protein